MLKKSNIKANRYENNYRQGCAKKKDIKIR